ncbi:thiamine biosynthesis protein ThiF [Clostridium carboxidivorans P7]|uniref:Thiamine biosynthesis protein ThiF n=1 Tax=Clostridium carboxidivorans P7 TaxID=536227 RepID=C6PR46_9CLOT|nr:sulfur carrier protein ThiS adenylyltransferase ThiF [Clostridium carboxidivorans]AKN29554.1 thiamine biosynthesis protein ThiF [Clostridium carboxidivorans P7]EET88270.1 thiamine biosynthesis protein ThiF [Clostridium carboxidivorans P7]EFG89520.1 thiamine biosynthesis protein ThiF [Clostridium carboxidivorans P7]
MNLYVNGKNRTTECCSLCSLRKELFSEASNIIMIYNGFQTENDIMLNEGDSVSFIEKGAMPSEDELEALMMARHTPFVHKKVKRARVAIAGLGGLGSNVAVALARTGIGHLHLVDFDIVEPSNLNRQAYKIRHLGMKKTEALKSEIEDINPYIKVSIDNVKVTEENAVSLFQNDPIVCEAFDRAEYKAMLINTLLEKQPEIKLVSASGLAGYESSNSITTRKVFNNLYLCGDRKSNAEPGRGLMAPRVSICAGHQANMILRLILGVEEV